jgi:hypothetical protein
MSLAVLKMLQGCCKGVTRVLQGRYTHVARVLVCDWDRDSRNMYRGMKLLQGCYKGVTRVLIVPWNEVLVPERQAALLCDEAV